jgi:hypothetical protein
VRPSFQGEREVERDNSSLYEREADEYQERRSVSLKWHFKGKVDGRNGTILAVVDKEYTEEEIKEK